MKEKEEEGLMRILLKDITHSEKKKGTIIK